jgi:hephaestin
MIYLHLVTIIAIFYLTIKPAVTNCNDEWSDLPNYDVDADRVYYIGCVEVSWNYCPSGYDLVSGEKITEGIPAAMWCLNGERGDRIGAEYLKGLYREFTDKCFDEQLERMERDEHLGALGPNIRALTGERIKVFYKNKCSFPNSIHTHGLKYDKLSEGAAYVDNDGINGGDVVEPDAKWIYIYDVRDNMVDESHSSKMWIYHSHVDPIKDVHTGLFGAIIITKADDARDLGQGDNDIIAEDIDREFTTFMVMYDENESWLFDENVEEYLGFSIKDAGADVLLNEADFIESNLMHAINGYLFGNLRGLIMEEDETVRWYTASFGNEGDGPHSPHWHGNIVDDSLGDNTDTVVLIPGTTYTVTMDVDNPGIWLYHCHVHDHIEAGMITTYIVGETPFNFKK